MVHKVYNNYNNESHKYTTTTQLNPLPHLLNIVTINLQSITENFSIDVQPNYIYMHKVIES